METTTNAGTDCSKCLLMKMMNTNLKEANEANTKLLAMVDTLQDANKRLTADNIALFDGSYISPELVKIQQDMLEDPTGEKDILIAQLRKDLEQAHKTIRTGQGDVGLN